MAQKGLRGLTYRAIAAEAGVSHALVTYFFPTREHLIEAAMQQAASRTVGASLDPSRASMDIIRRTFPQSIAATRDMQVFQYELTVEACRQPEIQHDAIALIETNVAQMGRFLEALGIDPSPGLVRLVYAAMDGLALQQLVYGDPTATDEAIAALIDWLDGTAAGTPQDDASEGVTASTEH